MNALALERFVSREPDAIPGRSTQFGYSKVPKSVEVTKFEREFGIATHDFYETRIKRLPAWKVLEVTAGGVREKIILLKRDVARKAPEISIRDDRNPVVPRLHTEYVQLDTSKLYKEQIPRPVLQTAATFKDIEDKLADYSKVSTIAFRNIEGISRAYYQWSDEEGGHSDALGLILEATGTIDRETQEQHYYDRLQAEWEPPTNPKDIIGILAYAAIQERLTALNYDGLAKTCKEAGALVASRIFGLISGDESFHGMGYRGELMIANQFDPIRVLKTTVQIAAGFEMPAQRMMSNYRRKLVEMTRAGALTMKMITDGAIFYTLSKYDFVPPELAREVADNYQRPEYLQRISERIK